MEDMSGVALLQRIKDLAERISQIEKITVYKVGFWALAYHYIYEFFLSLFLIIRHWL